MGAAWCRERIEHAHNSKSHVDRIIARCSNVIYPKYAKTNHAKLTKDIVFKPVRTLGVYNIKVGLQQTTDPSNLNVNREWTCNKLKEPSIEEKTPVPPPRKRRKRNINSLEILTNHLEQICAENEDQNDIQPAKGLKDNIEESQALRHKNRARRIMDNKTKFVKKDISRPLSLSIVEHNIEIVQDEPKLHIPKTISSTSLPNYLELCRHSNDWTRPSIQQKSPSRNASTGSLPGESLLAALSQVTKQRIEAYMRKCKSFGSQPLIQQQKRYEINNVPSESEDSWSGLDDWDLGVIEHCDPEVSSTLKKREVVFSVGPPATPKRQHNRSTPTPPMRSEFLKFSVKTPPPTPNELSESIRGVVEADTQQLLMALNKCKEKNDEQLLPPNPPLRKGRKYDPTRRQSFMEMKKDKNTEWTRSVSEDHVMGTELWPVEDVTNMRRSWQNLYRGSNRGSLQQALSEFMGLDVSPGDENSKATQEVNLNSSLFPVIGVADGDKAVAEMDDDRRTPLPPPLPSSPPPVVGDVSSPSLTIVSFT